MSVCLCTLAIWGRRINIYTWFCLEQVGEDGGTSTETIQKLVIEVKILGSQKELSAPATPTTTISLSSVCKSPR